MSELKHWKGIKKKKNTFHTKTAEIFACAQPGLM